MTLVLIILGVVLLVAGAALAGLSLLALVLPRHGMSGLEMAAIFIVAALLFVGGLALVIAN